MRLVALLLILAILNGCASSLKTFDSQQKPTAGIPIAIPILVKITEKTTYEVDPNNPNYANYCTSEINSKYQFLALGERNYIAFDSAMLGKGEFKVEFNESGILKSVSLNSDASAGIDKLNNLAGTVLPYLATPHSALNAAAFTETNDTAQKTKDKYCIKKGTELISIEKIDIKKE